MKSAVRLWSLGLALAALAPLARAEDAAVGASPGATAQPESPSADTAELVAGPQDLSLGADVRLALPDGWHWVPKDRLQAYFAGDGRKAGAWDLGLALSPGQPLFEFRVQFEPLGAMVEPAAGLDSAALMAKIQAAAATANQERRAEGGLEVQIPGWSLEPAYDAASKRLVWGERRQSGADERRGWHARLLGRAGVVKLDVEAADDLMPLQAPLLQALFNGLSLAEGHGLADRQAGDRPASVDLAGLVLEGTLGRGSLNQGPPPEASLPPVAVAGLEIVAALLLAWGGVALWRGLKRRRHMQDVVAAEVERLEKLEKELGGSAADVEEVQENQDDAAAHQGDDTHGGGNV